MPEQALVGGNADAGALDLASPGLAPELPGELTDLGDRLGGHGLTERTKATRRVDGKAAADLGDAVA